APVVEDRVGIGDPGSGDGAAHDDPVVGELHDGVPVDERPGVGLPPLRTVLGMELDRAYVRGDEVGVVAQPHAAGDRALVALVPGAALAPLTQLATGEDALRRTGGSDRETQA